MKRDKPILLIDENICKANIQFMSEKAASHGLHFRPHFKTHQSRMVAEWLKSVGVDSITVSSMDMAEYFNGQFGHITLAIPFNRHQIDHLNKLLNDQYMAIMVDDISTTRFLAAEAAGPLGVWIEIDTGSNRSGLDPRKPADVQQIIDEVENNHKLSLEGLYSHAGHTYAARSEKAVLESSRRPEKTS